MNAIDLPPFDIDDDDLRRRLDAIAARADAPLVDPLADLERGRTARRRRRTTGIAAGLVAVAAASAFVLGTVSGDVGPDASEHIADDLTTTTAPDPGASTTIALGTDDAETFGAEVARIMGRSMGEQDTAYASYVSGETSVVSFRSSSLVVSAGVSREALGVEGLSDVTPYRVGNAGVGEQGSFAAGQVRAYLFDQPDGEAVLVEVSGPASMAPSAAVIDALLTEVDVPASTLTPAEAWHNTMQVMGADALTSDALEVRSTIEVSEVPTIRGLASQGDRTSRRETGRVEWQGQTDAADTPQCPEGFRECGQMEIGGETFLAKYVAGGEREGWLYLERDHDGVRAQVILEPYADAWALPLDAVAELLLDERWSQMPADSSVGYPIP